MPTKSPPCSARRLGLLALLASGLSISSVLAQQTETSAVPEETARVTSGTALSPEHRFWLNSVASLISDEERAYFLAQRSDFRRDAFIEAFWQVRDPDPRTPVNELERRFAQLTSPSQGGLPPGDPRGLAFLLNGPPGRYTLPDGRPVAQCFSRSRELEIWFYGGSERTSQRFPLIFFKRARDNGYEVWLPGQPLRPVQRSGLPTTNIALLCADDALGYANYEISRITGYDRLVDQVLSPPRPSPEWLATLAAQTTDLPPDAETFPVEVEVDFPARKQSRTAVRVLARVLTEDAPGQRFDGKLFHNLMVIGEVLRDERLFEDFRYRFEGPTPEDAREIPVGFVRYLRPGTVTLRILIEDVYGERYAQVIREIDVPSPEGLPVEPSSTTVTTSGTGDDERPKLELLVPPGDVQVGLVRFTSRARGEFDRVAFFLDDRQVLSKRTPPYSAELDLGSTPEPHRVRVVGFVGDREVATDQLWLNQGQKRFELLLIEPRPGGIYPGNVTARAEVRTPDGNPPVRVELFLNDQSVAVIDEPPYARNIALAGSAPAVVRAVAYLADGSAAEDAVIINGADFTEQVEVRLVELLVSVTDRDGRPVEGLEQDRFRLLDEGSARSIERFEPVRELPLRVALLLDRSASMAPDLEAVSEAAFGFAQAALGPTDSSSPENQIAVLSFADRTRVDTPFDSSAGSVERALAGLEALGRTALWDALAQALNNFGDPGDQPAAPALVLFTDGRDEISQLDFEQTLALARRSGVVIYTIGLGASFESRGDRRELEQLAGDTGGQAFFLSGLDELASIYSQILERLRSGYLLTFQVPADIGSDDYRELRVEISGGDYQVRARAGYLP